MLGQRDANYRREIGVPSIGDRIRLHAASEVRRAPEQIATQAAIRVAAAASGRCLHVDLDVLDGKEFRACGAAGDASMSTGLTWAQLAAITRTSLRASGCRGWSVGVYNPDLDPDGRDAEAIVAYLVRVTSNGARTTA
jgi:arginase